MQIAGAFFLLGGIALLFSMAPKPNWVDENFPGHPKWIGIVPYVLCLLGLLLFAFGS